MCIERRYNHYHNPRDGRFTFSPGGPRSTGFRLSATPRRTPPTGRQTPDEFSPASPKNYWIYTVRPGDSLSAIAARRKGLRASDLADLNRLSGASTLIPGQRLALPNQSYLDAGKRARENLLNLAFFKDTHNGQLPPDVAHVPSIEKQVDTGFRRVVAKEYAFDLDVLGRTRKVEGQIRLVRAEPPSKPLQRNAGGKDRQQTDDGGHYVARRFDGPRAAFNHFAQNSSINRGAYRVLEDGWAKAVREGKKVFVSIRPVYLGVSLRPSGLRVFYTIDGRENVRNFGNRKKGQRRGKS